jgi:hypothetical protein
MVLNKIWRAADVCKNCLQLKRKNFAYKEQISCEQNIVKGYSATVDALSATVPCGQCLDFDGTLAICYVDCGLKQQCRLDKHSFYVQV